MKDEANPGNMNDLNPGNYLPVGAIDAFRPGGRRININI